MNEVHWGTCLLDEHDRVVHLDEGFWRLMALNRTPCDCFWGQELPDMLELPVDAREALDLRAKWRSDDTALLFAVSPHLHTMELVPLMSASNVSQEVQAVSSGRKSSAAKSKAGCMLVVSGFRQHDHVHSALRSFAGGIAHDMNNAVASLQGFGEILVSLTEGQPPMFGRSAGNILKGCEQARGVIDLLRTMGGCIGLDRQPVELSAFCESMLEPLREQSPQLQITFSGGIAHVIIDRERVRDAFMHVWDNACRAVEGEGRIDVTCKAGEREVALCVRDSGCGMSPDTIRHALDPYFSTYKKQGSKGRGLALVHGIMCAHGGRVHIVSDPAPHVAESRAAGAFAQSREPVDRGRGTAVTLCFPVVQSPNESF